MGGFQESLERIGRASKVAGFASSCWAALEGLKVRFLARPSEAYARFLSSLVENPKVREGWHASLLAEALLRPLVVSHSRRPPQWQQVKAEQRALFRLWVPRLEHQASRRGPGMALSGKQAIHQRLSQLSQEDIKALTRSLEGALSRQQTRGGNTLFWRQAKEVAARLAVNPN